MNKSLSLPQGHPVSIENAKDLLALGAVYRDILNKCCAPIYWTSTVGGRPRLLNNGTLTFLRTPKKLLGITAAHVVEAYEENSDSQQIRLQLMNAPLDDILSRKIAVSKFFDLITIEIDEIILKNVGKEITPLTWPPQLPQEDKGIMFGGFPEQDIIHDKNIFNFGFFTAMEICESINDRGITVCFNREYYIDIPKIETLPEYYNLSGISGGPLISFFESPNGLLSSYRLAGIIIQQPNYEKSDFKFERVFAARADVIKEDGKII